jgi:hypothetical protein
LKGDNSYFNSGGTAIEFLESDGLTTRPTKAADLPEMARLVEGLSPAKAVSFYRKAGK